MQTRNKESKKVIATARAIRRQIIDGIYPAGSQLPNRDQLIDEFGASRVTIQKSMDQLIVEGFIETKGRHGTSVSSTPPHEYQIGLVLYENATNSKVYEALQESIQRIEKTTPYRIKQYQFLNEYRQQIHIEELKRDLDNNLLAGVFFFYSRTFQLADYGIFDYKHIPMVLLAGDQNDMSGHREPHINFISFSYKALIDTMIAKAAHKKVAWIVNSYFNDDTIAYIMEECEKNGLQTESFWIQGAGLDQFSRKWLVNTIQLLMSSNKPESIIVLDENLLEPVVSGLHQSRLKVPDDVQLISHCSFPKKKNDLLSITKLGFDIHDLIQQVIEYINSLKKKPEYAEYQVNNITIAE